MKKKVQWWVIPAHIPHNRAKECYEWEYELEETNISGRYQSKWCPTCHLYAARQFENNPLVVARHTVEHDYSDPIWGSSWNVRFLYMGNPNTSFVRKLSTEFREITCTDIQYARSQISDLGQPRTEFDRMARRETLQVLEFLERHATPEYVILIEDEF